MKWSSWNTISVLSFSRRGIGQHRFLVDSFCQTHLGDPTELQTTTTERPNSGGTFSSNNLGFCMHISLRGEKCHNSYVLSRVWGRPFKNVKGRAVLIPEEAKFSYRWHQQKAAYIPRHVTQRIVTALRLDVSYHRETLQLNTFPQSHNPGTCNLWTVCIMKHLKGYTLFVRYRRQEMLKVGHLPWLQATHSHWWRSSLSLGEQLCPLSPLNIYRWAGPWSSFWQQS